MPSVSSENRFALFGKRFMSRFLSENRFALFGKRS